MVFFLYHTRVCTIKYGCKSTKKNTLKCVFFDGNNAHMHFFAKSTLQITH